MAFSYKWGNQLRQYLSHGGLPGAEYRGFKIEMTPGTTNWKAYVGTVNVTTWSNSGFTRNWSELGAERMYALSKYTDCNEGYYQYCEFREGTTTWKVWPVIQEAPEYDYDPHYDVYPNNSNHSCTIYWEAP